MTIHYSKHGLELVAAIIERGDDQLRDGSIGFGPHSDARWVIDILLGQLGYELDVDEDGYVSLVDRDRAELDIDPILPDHYRVAKDENGKWLHRGATGFMTETGGVG